MTNTSQVTSRAALNAAAARQAAHETGECPTCHGAAHPMVLTRFGQCTTCHTTALRARLTHA